MPLLIVVSCLWAFSFPLIKANLGGLDSTFVAAARLVLSLLVFVPLLRLARFSPRTFGALAGTGAVQFGLMYVLYLESFRYLPAHVIVLLTTTTPVFVTLISDGWQGRLAPRMLAAAALAVAAGAVVKYPSQPLSVSIVGILLLQGSNIAFAFGQVAYRRISGSHKEWSDGPAMGIMYAGAVVAATLALAVRPSAHIPESLTAAQVGTLLYLGVVASGLGFFMWNRGSRAVSTGVLAVMNNAKIPLGIVASVVMLSEATDWLRLTAGLALMALALVVAWRPQN